MSARAAARSTSRAAWHALLDRLPRTTLVVGKGGVGKTTTAAAVAGAFAERGERTLLLSTDPAAALGTVLGAPVATAAAPVAGEPHLDARQLAAASLRAAFLDRWRDVIAEIVDRGTYLDREDVEGLVDAALPGADEIFALLALADLVADGAYTRLVIDTAPTGHTLRLLALPDTFRALIEMLDLMQGKHRFMVRALTRRYTADRADAFLDEMRARIDGLRATLADPRRSAAVVVTRLEPVVAAETARYVAQLRALRVAVAALVVNAIPEHPAASASETRRILSAIDHSIPRLWLGEARTPLVGLHAIGSAFQVIASDPPHEPRGASRALAVPVDAPPVALADLPRTLTIVAGKGGVGKSTVACAIALACADARAASGTAGDVLLVSTDPAPSLADALGESHAPWAARGAERRLDARPNLVVHQMDAAAAFARMRDAYQERIDGLFDTLVGRGVDVAHDRAILRELMALAPPGVDELFALAALGDALDGGAFARVIVDPAPTGHLLRLVEMPALALEWAHRLMRLMLKYQHVVGLGDTAQQLLDFARRARAFDALLHDARRTAVIVVSLDEPVVRAESVRLAQALGEHEVHVSAVVWNRWRGAAVTSGISPLPVRGEARQFVAGEANPPPVGLDALRAWARTWMPAPRSTL